MSRIRISNRGIDIAKAGYDVETASPENMAFSSEFVAMRVLSSGYVTAVPYSGAFSDRYRLGVVTYPQPYASPPVVMVAGMPVSGVSQQTAGNIYAIPVTAGTAWLLPHYMVASYTNRFELYLLTDYTENFTWKYWLFGNQLTG